MVGDHQWKRKRKRGRKREGRAQGIGLKNAQTKKTDKRWADNSKRRPNRETQKIRKHAQFNDDVVSVPKIQNKLW